MSLEFVAIRLLGLYAVIQALGLFSELARVALLPRTISGIQSWETGAFLLLPFALLLALAYTFTAHPGLVAEKLLHQDRPATRLPAPLAHLGFIVAGVVILGNALPELTALLHSSSDIRPELMAGTMFQVLLGLLALLKPESMAGPVKRGSTRPPEGNPEYPINDLGALALAVVGIVLFASAVPFLVPAVASYFLYGAHAMNPDALGSLYVAAPKAIVGLVLFLRPREIMQLLGKRILTRT